MLTDIQFEQAVAAFVTFFVVIDAVGVAPIFASLTAPGGAAYARKMAFKATFVATLIMFFFAFGGRSHRAHWAGLSVTALIALISVAVAIVSANWR